jgi:AraC-like DNA-binding protein
MSPVSQEEAKAEAVAEPLIACTSNGSADYVGGHLAESISIEALAELAGLSPFHFSRVFKQATGMTPHQFVVRERMLQAQQLIRESSCSLITVAALIARNQTIEMPAYFNLALDDGVKPSELSEIITHLAFYSGWANAMAAVAVAKEVFGQRGIGVDSRQAARNAATPNRPPFRPYRHQNRCQFRAPDRVSAELLCLIDRNRSFHVRLLHKLAPLLRRVIALVPHKRTWSDKKIDLLKQRVGRVVDLLGVLRRIDQQIGIDGCHDRLSICPFLDAHDSRGRGLDYSSAVPGATERVLP